MENDYKKYTDEIRKLYLSFRDSEFNGEQAFELTKLHVSQTLLTTCLDAILIDVEKFEDLTRHTQILKEYAAKHLHI